jgi:hypothetical protein
MHPLSVNALWPLVGIPSNVEKACTFGAILLGQIPPVITADGTYGLMLLYYKCYQRDMHDTEDHP